MERKEIFFVSDAHFGIALDGYDDREEVFAQFLRQITPRASHLFILGDLFDFWIEYKYAIRPDYFLVLCELRRLVENQVKVHYVAGNHDFALGPFFSEISKIHVHLEPFTTTLQNKKVHLSHGDGVIAADIGYRILRKILRNPINQKLYKMMHPDLGVSLGTFFSGSSRKYLKNRITPYIIRKYQEYASGVLKQNLDHVIFGHTHRAELTKMEHGIYCNSGAWLIHYNYVTMCDGELKLWRYNKDGSSTEITG